jgi:outer membrane protein TolC
MFSSIRIGAVVAAAAIFALTLRVHPLAAQQPTPARNTGTNATPRSLSLDEALRIAERESESIQIARAGVDRARGTQQQARSQYLPQLNGSLQYTRTLKSQFEVLQDAAPEPGPDVPPVPSRDTTTFFQPCTRYLAAAGAGQVERVAGLEAFAQCSSGGGIDFTKVGFGAPNQYQLGLTGSVNLFTGGRVTAQNAAAAAGRRSASIELTAQRAQLQLDVAEAYYDAALADRLVDIADSSLVQTEEALRQTTLAREVGNQSEFDLLRARVTRDNQLPPMLQARTTRNLTYLRLKQLLNLPYSDSLVLTDGIVDVEEAANVRVSASTGNRADLAAMVFALTDSIVQQSDTNSEGRATVRQLGRSGSTAARGEGGVSPRPDALDIVRSRRVSHGGRPDLEPVREQLDRHRWRVDAVVHRRSHSRREHRREGERGRSEGAPAADARARVPGRAAGGGAARAGRGDARGKRRNRGPGDARLQHRRSALS